MRRYSASTSTPSPNGNRNSPLTPKMYRLGWEKSPRVPLVALSTKSVKGTPTFSPAPKGCENAQTALNTTSDNNFMKMRTARRVPRFLPYQFVPDEITREEKNFRR